MLCILGRVPQHGGETMATYTLRYSDDGRGLDKKIEFQAEDASGALIVAYSEAPHRNAELWEGARKLCTIRRYTTEVWRIGA
ncbi:hypothetical protein JI59_22350 (plasmid) [Novosphingobium pentaromativorans US6-1]|nr:hypothetical protein JI59_22350 [Novosphingobium pentaromativorans US6-1]